MEISNPACRGCGGPHPFDTSVPSVLWNRVVRASGLPDYLCTTCIVRAFANAGESFMATLHGNDPDCDFNGLSIEVIINGRNAKALELLEAENNRLRVKLRELDPQAVDEFCR